MTPETRDDDPPLLAVSACDPSSSVPRATACSDSTPLEPHSFAQPLPRHHCQQSTPRDAHDPHHGLTIKSSIEPASHGVAADRNLATKSSSYGEGAQHYTTVSKQAKRASGQLEGSRPPHKKPRSRMTPPGTIDLSPFAKPALPQKLVDGLTSPLFFSHSSLSNRPLMMRPPSFPGIEAAGTMLNRVRDGADVTTLKLARGTINAASPVRSSSTPGSASSIDNPMFNRSPDVQSPGLQGLQGVGVIDLLERDDRPTFIVDASNPLNNAPGPFAVLYGNPALQVADSVRHLVYRDFRESNEGKDEHHQFKTWVRNAGSHPDGLDVFMPSYHYGGVDWTCSAIKDRYRFVSANVSAASVGRTSPEPPLERETSVGSRSCGVTPNAQPMTPSDTAPLDRDYFGGVDTTEVPARLTLDTTMEVDHRPLTSGAVDPNSTPIAAELPSFDWTRIPLTPELPRHIRFARSIDWAATPLGPIETWSADLRAMANMVMASPHPAAMYWGKDLIIIYNEAYISLAGAKHPELMGQKYEEAWSDIWPIVKPVFESAWESGQATLKNDDRLIMDRSGFPEEAFFAWSIVPLVGQDGSVVGLYNPSFENTRRKVAERRMLTLRQLGEKTALARDVKSFWSQVKAGLDLNEEDIPFLIVYSVSEEQDGNVSSIHSGSMANPPHLTLEASHGVPQGHHCLVDSLDLRTSDEGFAPYIRESMSRCGAPIKLSMDDGTMPQGLMDGFERSSQQDPCRSIVVFPIHPTTGSESVVGFLVIGLNPRRPYDDDYELFVSLLSRQLATSLASVVLFEEEIKRGQKAATLAALDRQTLTEQLHERTLEVEESELKFTRMAEFAPVGMFIADGAGHITYCNDMWWEISGHPRSAASVNTWTDSVKDEDRPALDASWARLVKGRFAITQEFRFRSTRQFGEHTIDTWVLMSAYPERDRDGTIKGIFGCMTDISQQKLAEWIQNQRREEAVELKRQQENFIDITSHEMRNPLSAILQCADEIASTVGGYRSANEMHDLPDPLKLVLDASTEAANTITLCASHQKRIVDDILTLSKLDSQLLLVTPVDVQPLAIVQRVLKMFEGELNTHGIQILFNVKNRYLDMGIDWVKLDPSRLIQVLINLMTNAIKFTQTRPTRSIIVTLDASREIQKGSDDGIMYFPSDRPDTGTLTDHSDWGGGEKLNLHFSVQDTGSGLDEHERSLLFQRFSQTTPRTHVQYGGSGLGLFISRILTELQGGQIGVVSEKGVGSTFSFYVQSRKTSQPEDAQVQGAAPPLTRAPGSSTIIEKKQPKSTTSIDEMKSVEVAASVHSADGRPCFDVLIVEDNLVNQKVLQRQLRNVGNNTRVANHGGEAIELLKTSRFWQGNESTGDDISVILMDLEMPVMDGMTCARKIRELERDGVIVSHIPIIAVTAYARPEQIEDAKAAGVDDVISKPFRMPELMPRIEQLALAHASHSDGKAS